MEITNTTKQAKSVVNESLYISYNIRSDKNKMQDVSGSIFKENSIVGHVSYDCIRAGFQFSLAPENGLSVEEKKQAFEQFLTDVEESKILNNN